jgi:hypothetical protein
LLHARTLLGRWSNLASTENVGEILTLATTNGIVGLSIIVLLEVSFQPLAELQIVLVLCFHELAHLDMALDAVLVEGLLQHFVVLNKLMFVLRVPLDFTEVKSSGVKAV